tara:strand:+ start:299 stop:1945 length:1647 start_codon:yes stop_codon:yes gene_type:complete
MKRNSFTKPPQQQLNDLFKHYQYKRFNEVEKLSLSIIKEFPRNQFARKILGATLGQLGRISEALSVNQTLVTLDPKDSEAYLNLGATLEKLGRLDEAIDSFKKAISLKPDYAKAYYNLGLAMQKLGKLDEAIDSFKKAISLKPEHEIFYLNLGAILQIIGRLEEAETIYQKAISLKPHFAFYLNLGTTLKGLGRLEEAMVNYKKAISLKPDLVEAHRHLSMIKKFDSKDEQYSIMHKLYLDEKISKAQRCHINFALAKASEDLGDFEQAFKHYNEGNAFKKQQSNYEFDQDMKFFTQLKTNYPQIKKNSLELKGFVNKLTPIFIIGMPRSGTTLVEQIVSSHPKVSAGGELSFVKKFGEKIARGLSNLNIESLIEFRKKYLNQLQNFSNNKSIVTDKMPHNFLYVGLIAAVFPEAKIVHVKRNPAAVCWSNYKKLFATKKMSYSFALDDIIKHYELYKNLMMFWTEHLPNKIYDVNYELLTVNQKSETEKLINYLGLDWDEKCLSPQDNMRSIRTASDIQVRKKVYQGSSQQWEKYKPFLNGVFDYFN